MRHGQTDWNVSLRLQGISDIPLNETGLTQAESASEKIHASDWDLILASPLQRAHKTAEIIAAKTGLDIVLVPDLVRSEEHTSELQSH